MCLARLLPVYLCVLLGGCGSLCILVSLGLVRVCQHVFVGGCSRFCILVSLGLWVVVFYA